MNPYLEQPSVWLGFHGQFVPAISQALNALLDESYVALVEEQIYIQEVDEPVAKLAGRADVGITRRPPRGTETGGSALLEPPLRVLVPMLEPEALARVEIRARGGKDLVTVIELLSPTNKRPGVNRDQYLSKRSLVLNSDAHFVEIDLLRGWEPMPLGTVANADYRVLVSRAEERPDAGLWPLLLRERLPVIPIPLRGADADVRIDLQALLDGVYDAAAYRKLIYDGEPVPPLSFEDAAWAAAIGTNRNAE